MLRVATADELAGLLDDSALIEALRTMFAEGCELPRRHHHTIETGGAEATLLLMPAWQAGGELGDVVQPLASGVLTEAAIGGDLFELARGERPGRISADEITLFKSVGIALEDLAAARLAVAGLG